jgi:LemA protein
MNQAFPTLDPVPAAPPSRKGIWVAASAIVLMAGVGLTFWVGVGQYNALQDSDVRIDYSWNQVINQYTRRMNLVPNLVAVVQSYARNETALFAQIAATRSSLAALSTPESRQSGQFQAAQHQLSGQLARLLLVAEQYPELKSSSLYQDLMVQLEGTENRLAFARQQYHAGVADYNAAIRRFPGNLIASQSGMKQRPVVAIEDEAAARRPVAIDLK